MLDTLIELQVVIYRPPGDLIRLLNRHLCPLAARVQPIQHVIEYLLQRKLTHVGQDIPLELSWVTLVEIALIAGLPLVRFSSYDALSPLFLKTFNGFIERFSGYPSLRLKKSTIWPKASIAISSSRIFPAASMNPCGSP